MNRKGTLLSFFLFFVPFLYAQESTQVFTYFEEVSNAYSLLTDYKARISFQSGGGRSDSGTLFVKGPKLRINMENGTVISVNDGKVVVYIRNQRVAMEQQMSGLNTGSKEGLRLLKRHYRYSYFDEKGYSLVPLEEGSRENVVKLRFEAKSNSLEFRWMIISFNSSKLIRRIEGMTFGGSKVIFNFTNYRVNQGIADNQFNYNAPGDTNAIKDFIFTPE